MQEYAKISDSLSHMEDNLSDTLIEEWKEEEHVFCRDVLDIKKHKDLRNIYELTKDNGMCWVCYPTFCADNVLSS